MCYMHAIVQTMVACTPFVNLLHELRVHTDAARMTDAPLLRCMYVLPCALARPHAATEHVPRLHTGWTS